MKVTTTDGKAFTLVAETQTDQQFVDTVHLVRHVVLGAVLPNGRNDGGGWTLQGIELHVDSAHPQKLVADASRQALRALGDLFRLGLREAALNGHVGANATDPQAKVPLPVGLEQLKLVLQALGLAVVEHGPVFEKVDGHRDTSVAGSVSSGGQL